MIDTDEFLTRILKKYKKNSKKYNALAKKIQQKVKKALSENYWSGGEGDGAQTAMSEHPYLALVEELSAAALAKSNEKKNSDEVQGLLKKYPWDDVLEVVTGLQDGSDRAIPDHNNGFINIGSAPDKFPGFPDLSVNHYLYGFREIVGWQYRVKSGKQMTFQGREKKTEKPVMETELPSWEIIRIYLDGMIPEVSLFAIPWMTHLIHSELVDKRRMENGDLSSMDELLAFLDSKWNGFYFNDPHGKKPVAFVFPVHALFTEKDGFVYQFPDAASLANSGDIPFFSLRAYKSYGTTFMNKTVEIRNFVRDESDADEVRRNFYSESVYLRRYKNLIDVFVRAILAPNIGYPAYLDNFDYKTDDLSFLEKRYADGILDMPRKHALLVWAHVDKDIKKLADFLHENILATKENRFPEDVVLPAQLTVYIRANEQNLLKALAERIEAGSVFDREFSPHSKYGINQGSARSDFLASSHYMFHKTVTDVIKRTARECVLKEIGDKWIDSSK